MDEVKIYSEAVQYIKIEMGTEMFGIDISYVDNIVRPQHVTRVPNVASYIKGVINIRGEIIPIMSLRLKMGLEEIEETKSTRFIIIKMEKYGKIGLIVDAVKEVVALEDSQIERVKVDTSEELAHFVSGVGKVDGVLVSLLDLDMVVMEKSTKEE
ncbi:MAG: chemotaxis protein CheW [Lachnospiraceae bacterium]|jgi:purine-binding chemotaxis protein CheW|nr:chemotaxis protein CheW [Lachnospiraceae bacterium]